MKFKCLLVSILLISNFAICQTTIPKVKVEAIEKLMQHRGKGVQIINFWATWCKPCISELPDFERFYAENRNKNINLLLVSLDFAKDYEKVRTFVQKKALKAPVWYLDESDPNTYINKISEKWEGSLPSTLIINYATGHTYLFEKPLNYKELSEIVSKQK